MKRRAALLLFALSVVAGATLYAVSYKVSALDERLIALNEEITRDREAIHVLRAEWSYLNQPERLEGLSQRYLGLQPLAGNQFAAIGSVPVRTAPAPQPSPDEAGPAEADVPVASALTAAPKPKPAAPRRPTGSVRLAAQPVTPTGGMSASETAALNASLHAILGSAGGRSR
jgi:hypothetical protein